MGSLLASVAHELNNPLSVVTMQADLLSDEMSDQAGTERVRLISQSAERCVRIVQNFLAFARQTPPQRTDVALNAVVEEAMKLLTYTLQVDDVDIQLHLDEPSATSLGRSPPIASGRRESGDQRPPGPA